METQEPRMEAWMRISEPLDGTIQDHKRIFDAWEEGGVGGLVIGRMLLAGPDGKRVPAFTPNPEVYHKLDVEPPPPPQEEFPELRQGLDQMLDDARGRGWPILIFEAAVGAGPGGKGHIFGDPVTQRARWARMQDTLEHFPQVEGAVMDGPEWGYEIHPHHRSNIFQDLDPSLEEKARELGYDYRELVAAKEQLEARLHNLDPDYLCLHAPGGLMGALSLFGVDSALAAWFRFRVEALTAFFKGVREHMDTLDRPIKLGLGPRSAAFAPLCGYDFKALAEYIDILLPKHYFWNRGVDGFYGTVARYVEALTGWNPQITDRQALDVVRAFFGIELPGIERWSDFDEVGFPDEFFAQIVVQETRRAIAAVDDPYRILPWVDAGRSPHGGDPMDASVLKKMLLASREAGLVRFLNHVYIYPSVWVVISKLCGKMWKPDYEGGYLSPT